MKCIYFLIDDIILILVQTLLISSDALKYVSKIDQNASD